MRDDWYNDVIEVEFRKIIDNLRNFTLYGEEIDTYSLKELVVSAYYMGYYSKYSELHTNKNKGDTYGV